MEKLRAGRHSGFAKEICVTGEGLAAVQHKESPERRNSVERKDFEVVISVFQYELRRRFCLQLALCQELHR